MTDEHPTKKAKPSEHDAFQMKSREGYFGDTSAVTDSNATGDPRIILDERFGEPRAGASLTALSISEDEVKRQLSGCSNRYEIACKSM